MADKDTRKRVIRDDAAARISNISSDSAKIQWHPAFASALQLELLENRDDLEYRQEEILV